MDSNRVEILGRHYTISGVGDRAYIEELARFVDSQMKQIMESSGTVDTLKVAILAALNIADSYFKARGELPRDSEEMERKITALSEKIEAALSN